MKPFSTVILGCLFAFTSQTLFSQNITFDLRDRTFNYDEGLIEDLEANPMQLTLNNVCATFIANDGVPNQTTSGFGINASASGDDTDALDSINGILETYTIKFNVDIVLLHVDVSSFSSSDSGVVTLPDSSQIGIGSTGITTMDSAIVRVGDSIMIAYVAGNGFSFDGFTLYRLDSDGDGIFDESDNCIFTPNPLQDDDDTDGLGNLCDCDFLASSSNISETWCVEYASPSGKTFNTSGVYNDTIENSFGCDSVITIDLTINLPSSSVLHDTVCDVYVSPSGKEFLSTGTFFDTIPNYLNCDSVLTIHLIVKNSTFSNMHDTVCGSYVSPSGKILTHSGIFNDTIENSIGCDSIITINLVVNQPSSSELFDTVCGTYLSPGGKTWDISGTYSDTVQNFAGCDSVLTIHLIVNTSSSSFIADTVCDNYISPSGKEITMSGIHFDTTLNALGCDSLITLDLQINYSSGSTVYDTVCDNYKTSKGNIYTESGLYLETIENNSGCDSIINYNLIINKADTNVIVSDTQLQTNAADAIFSWMDCITGIVLDNNESIFQPEYAGNFALIVEQNNCVDTSNCYYLDYIVSTNEPVISDYLIYPNPTSGSVFFFSENPAEIDKLLIIDISGKKMLEITQILSNTVDLNLSIQPGIYHVLIYSNHHIEKHKLIVE